MCVAAAGKVIEVNNGEAIVDFNGNRVHAKAGFTKVEPGDNVLVHAGCILQVMKAKEADELRDLFAEIGW